MHLHFDLQAYKLFYFGLCIFFTENDEIIKTTNATSCFYTLLLSYFFVGIYFLMSDRYFEYTCFYTLSVLLHHNKTDLNRPENSIQSYDLERPYRSVCKSQLQP